MRRGDRPSGDPENSRIDGGVGGFVVGVGVVAYLREARGAGEMPENQHDEVACRRELPRVYAVRVRCLFDEPAWDSLNNLPQSMVYSWRCLVVVCFHACRVYRKTGKATLRYL